MTHLSSIKNEHFHTNTGGLEIITKFSKLRQLFETNLVPPPHAIQRILIPSLSQA